jgi:hypothetical protein
LKEKKRQEKLLQKKAEKREREKEDAKQEKEETQRKKEADREKEMLNKCTAYHFVFYVFLFRFKNQYLQFMVTVILAHELNEVCSLQCQQQNKSLIGFCMI